MNKEIQKFVTSSMIFLVVCVVIFILISTWYTKTIEPQKLVVKKINSIDQYISSNSKTVTYAFFGDSHVENNINTEYIPNGYNFGVTSDDYIETYYRLENMINNGLEIEYIILEIDPHIFSTRMRESNKLFSEINYYNKIVPRTDLKELTGKNELELFIASHSIIGKGEDVIYYMESTLESDSEEEYTEQDFSSKNKVYEANRRYIAHFGNSPELIQEKTFTKFLEIVQIAKQDNMKIIFVKYPLTTEYIYEIESHNISLEEHYKELFERINIITTDYQVLDYQTVYESQSNYFVDPDHLNSLGAKELSQEIYKDLELISNKK